MPRRQRRCAWTLKDRGVTSLVRLIDSVAERSDLDQWLSGDEGAPLTPGTERPPGGTPRRWRAPRAPLAAGCLVALVAAALVCVFHLNRPSPFIPYHDTMEYVQRANIILAGGPWADPARMPGYPLFLAGLFLFAGRGNLLAADWAQSVLFVLTAVGVYLLALRLWRRVAVALVVGLLFASNLYILSYVKPILSDGLALLLTVLLALAVVSYLARPAVWRLWLATALTLGLVLTRAEWALVPVPLYLYLLLAVGWRRVGRRLAGHALAGAAVIYGALAALVAANLQTNGFAGLTDAEGINLYGKVTQYGMQNLAPPRYASLMRLTDRAMAHGVHDPWSIYGAHPAIGRDHFTHLGSYAHAVILGHPLEFIQKTVPVFFQALYAGNLFAKVRPHGLLGPQLLIAAQLSSRIVSLFGLCLLAGLVWWAVLLLTRRLPRPRHALALAALTLLALYDLVVTAVGSYDEYARLHLEAVPLLLVVGIGSALWLARAGLALPWRGWRARSHAAYPPPEAVDEERSAA